MLYAIVAVLVLLMDQGLKYWVMLKLPLNEGSLVLIPGVLQLTHVHNYGEAFGMLKNLTWLFLVVTALFCAVVIYSLATRKIASRFGNWMALLVMAGALGNGIDRAICGYVVDMFDLMFPLPLFGEFAVFNVADCFITVCGILFCIFLIFSKDPLLAGSPAAGDKKPGRSAGSGGRSRGSRRPTPPARRPSASGAVEPDVRISPERPARQTVPRSPAARQSAPVPAAPPGAAVHSAAPPATPVPAPTTEPPDDEFSLESILAEFGDK